MKSVTSVSPSDVLDVALSSIPVITAYTVEVLNLILRSREKSKLIGEIDEKIRELKARRAKFEKAYQILLEKRENIRRRIVEVESELQSVRKAIERLRRAQELIERDIERARDDARILERKIRLWEKLYIIDLILQRIAHRSMGEKYRRALEDVLTEIDKKLKKLDSIKKDIEALKDRGTVLEEDRHTLNTELNRISEDIARVARKIRDLDYEENRLRYRIAEIEREHIDSKVLDRLTANPILLVALLMIPAYVLSGRSIELVHTMSFVRDRGRFVIAFVKPLEHPYTVFYTDSASLLLSRYEIEKLYATTLHELLHLSPVWIGLRSLNEDEVTFLVDTVRRYSSARSSWKDIEISIEISPIQYMISEEIASRVSIYNIYKVSNRFVLDRGVSKIDLPVKIFPRDLRDRRSVNYLRQKLREIDRETINFLSMIRGARDPSQVLSTLRNFIILKS
ncbi:MAG: hypothetical protein GXO23_02435 [Crenarchaeota archaeon]|nr:hypothetical protein [Thermoproteota archaeon]